MQQSLESQLLSLVCHRRDVFAQQHHNGAYTPIQRELTEDDLAEHLGAQASYGTYVIDPADNTVRYIVWDLDILDEDAATSLCSLVQELVNIPEAGEYPCLLREFSGNKGTHVWLFFDEPVPAEKVRRWVAADFMPHWVKMAEEKGWPEAIEVFPKQDTVPVGGFGNLIKIPLGVHAKSGARSEIVGYHDWPTSVEGVQPFPASLVPDREAVERPNTGTSRRMARTGTNEGPASPFACVDEILRNGVGQGNRDNAMFHIALYCYGHGIDEDLALEQCMRANDHFDPPMKDNEVQHKVRSAYTGRYASARCGTDWLKDVCPGPCQAGWQVRQEVSSSGLNRSATGTVVEVSVLRVQDDGHTRRVTVTHPDAENTPTFISRK